MADLDLSSQANDAIAPAHEAAPVSAAAPVPSPSSRSSSEPMSGAQAEQILAELKAIRQNLLWVLLLGGFFAARAFFFHY